MGEAFERVAMLVPLSVTDVMSDEVETVEEAVSVRRVAERLDSNGIGSLVVVRDGEAVGIVTESDVVALVGTGTDPASATVADVLSSPLVTVDADASIEHAARRLAEYDVRRLPVMRDGELAGIVSTSDLSFYLPRLTLQRSGHDAGEYATLGTDETAYEAPGWEFTRRDENDDGAVGVGDVVRFAKELSDTDVRSFAKASGDTNRLHLDDEFASRTRFGGRIAHGTLVSGLISSALARIPGLTIYISQDLRFLAPVAIGDTVTAVCEVIEDLGRGKFRLATAVYDEAGERVVDGEATVLVDELPDDADEKLEPVE